jgi:hypothetical protein
MSWDCVLIVFFAVVLAVGAGYRIGRAVKQ